MEYREIKKSDDAALADIIRSNLKAHKLDIPGTAYYDHHLDRLSEYYLKDGSRRFYLVAQKDGAPVGGIGLAELDFFDDCAELQKLYLADSVKGHGTGYILISMIEEKARELGYKQIYLETHSNLKAAIHIYEKCGYKEIDRPAEAVHGTMDRFFLKKL